MYPLGLPRLFSESQVGITCSTTHWLCLDRGEMNVARLRVPSPEFISLWAFVYKGEQRVCTSVCEWGRGIGVERAACAYWCVSANLLLICLIHPSVCICLMNRILRLTVSRLNCRSKPICLFIYLFLCSHMCLNKRDRAGRRGMARK